MRSVNPRFMTDPKPFWEVPPAGFPDLLEAGGGQVVTISMNEQTMTRKGFVPYGPSGAAVEALGRVIAADMEGTPGPPIVWLASPEAAGVHDQRIVASHFEEWLAAR